MLSIQDTLSSFSLAQNLYFKTKLKVENCINSLGRNIKLLEDISKDSLLELITNVKSFIENHSSTFFFIICSLFTYKYAFSRFAFFAAVTLVFQNKLEQPNEPIISMKNLALSIIGAIGLVFHKMSYPLSNPFFYFAPILSGYAFSKTMYSLFRSYFPLS